MPGNLITAVFSINAVPLTCAVSLVVRVISRFNSDKTLRKALALVCPVRESYQGGCLYTHFHLKPPSLVGGSVQTLGSKSGELILPGILGSLT